MLSIWNPGSVSATVGVSAKAGKRFSDVTASKVNLPFLTCEIVPSQLAKMS